MSFNINNVPNNANTFLPPTPVIPGTLLITDISRSYPMIVSFDNSNENTYIIGQVVVLIVPASYGMIQANGNQGRILQIAGSNFLLDIDSRQYDKFVVPSGIKVTQPASLSPGGCRNLEFSNLTNIEPFQSITGIITTIMALQFNKRIYSVAGNYVYIPTAGMSSCIVEVIGAGGGGGGAQGTNGAGSGGGSGAYAVGVFDATQIGASQSLTVGAGGAGGTAGANNGLAGTASNFGSFLIASGGSGGFGGVNSAGSSLIGGDGGIASGSAISFSTPGQRGGASFVVAGVVMSGFGGNSVLGSGGGANGANALAGHYGPGFNGTNGGGGSGANTLTPNNAGGNGGDGIVIITEFIV